MARLTLILTALTTIVALLGGVRFLVNEWRTWRRRLLPVVVAACMASPAQAQVTDYIHLPWDTSHIEQSTVHSSHANNCKEQDQTDVGGVIWVTCDDLYSGTNPRAIVKMSRAVGYGSDGAIRSYGLRRSPAPGNQ